MNLAELTTAIRSILMEPIPARWSNEDIKRYLNDGILELAIVADTTVSKEVPVSAGGNIDITDDMLIVRSVYWDLDDEYKELCPGLEMLPKSKARGVPDKYFIAGDKIELRPIPDVDGYAKIGYVKKPALLENETGTPEIKNADKVLIAYGAWQAFLEDGSPYTQIWETEYTKRLMNWHSFYSDNNQIAFRPKGVW